MVFDRNQLRLKQSSSFSNLAESVLVHNPIRKECTLQRVPSAPDLHSNAAYVRERYAPKVSRYHYYRDYDLLDEYWIDRRSYYTPLRWPYTFFGGRRYNMIDSPYSVWWHFPGLEDYPQRIRYSYLEHVNPGKLSEALGLTSGASPKWSYAHKDFTNRPWNFLKMDSGRAVNMYKQGLIDFRTLEEYWLTPSYIEKRTQKMKDSYGPMLYPKYVASY